MGGSEAGTQEPGQEESSLATGGSSRPSSYGLYIPLTHLYTFKFTRLTLTWKKEGKQHHCLCNTSCTPGIEPTLRYWDRAHGHHCSGGGGGALHHVPVPRVLGDALFQRKGPGKCSRCGIATSRGMHHGMGVLGAQRGSWACAWACRVLRCAALCTTLGRGSCRFPSRKPPPKSSDSQKANFCGSQLKFLVCKLKISETSFFLRIIFAESTFAATVATTRAKKSFAPFPTTHPTGFGGATARATTLSPPGSQWCLQMEWSIPNTLEASQWLL